MTKETKVIILVVLLLLLIGASLPSLAVTFPVTCPHLRDGLTNHTFGMVRNNGTKAHQGWDIVGEKGSPVVATLDGVIDDVGHHESYGSYVLVKHFGVFWTFYAHLDSISVTVGTFIKQGKQIGTVGNSGNAIDTVSHVHFELRLIRNPGLGLTGRKSPINLFGMEAYKALLLDTYPCDS